MLSDGQLDLAAVEAFIEHSRRHHETVQIRTADAGALIDELARLRAELEQLRSAAVSVSATMPVELQDLPETWQSFAEAMAALRQLL